MDPAKVVSRSNSDLLAIDMISANTNLSTPARMEAIYAYAVEWHKDTRLHPSQNSIGTREYKRAKEKGHLFQGGNN